MNICVFCSSSNDIADVYRKDALLLGKKIGEKSHSLIYGGANMGLMQVCATAVRDAGGTVIGIVPDNLRKNTEQKVLDQVFFVADLAERKEMMIEYADVFIALPGGFGTLDEVFEVLALATVEAHDKKLIIVNTNGYYTHLLAHIEHSIQEKAINASLQKTFAVANSIGECFSLIENENTAL